MDLFKRDLKKNRVLMERVINKLNKRFSDHSFFSPEESVLVINKVHPDNKFYYIDSELRIKLLLLESKSDDYLYLLDTRALSVYVIENDFNIIYEVIKNFYSIILKIYSEDSKEFITIDVFDDELNQTRLEVNMIKLQKFNENQQYDN